jgi:hypothetical protein
MLRFMAVGGVLVVASGLMAYQAIDISLHYTKVDARVQSVHTDCYVERSYKNRVVVEGTKELAYFNCTSAKDIAVQYGFDESDIHTRSKVAYSYKSPADGSTQKGSFERSDLDESIKSGRTIEVHAHNKIPSDSRTTKANFFIADSGE